MEQGPSNTQSFAKQKQDDVIIDCSKEEAVAVAVAVAVAAAEEPPVTQKPKRVATLDAFRGLTIVVSTSQTPSNKHFQISYYVCVCYVLQLMILVDDAGGAYSRIDHSPWNGCTLADFVMPFFLFIVGVAIALAFKVFLYHLV